MIRRKFLEYSSKTLLSLGLGFRLSPTAKTAGLIAAPDTASSEPAQQVLPGTAPLTQHGDLAELMEEGIQRLLLQCIQDAPKERARLRQWDYCSAGLRKFRSSPSKTFS
jgi:hypothetical protein